MIVGIGTDLAEVERFRFGADHLEWYARKIYTDEEMRYALSKREWPERLAGFFAAKEAVRKAFGFAIPWRQVGVTHEKSGKPAIVLFESAAALPEKHGVSKIHLSITHTALAASAFVVLEG